MKGFFIVLEGIDGCGKTTQLKALTEWLPTSGLMHHDAQLVVTREPGGTSFGAAMRDMLLNPEAGKEPCSRSELLLYMADRAQHVETVIKPALEAGNWVLCDRFNMSTIAYQGYGRKHSLTMVDALQNFVSARIEPDLTLWIDISITKALERIKYKQPDRIELEGVNFLKRVHSGYCAAKSLDPKVIRINGNQDIDKVSEDCKRKIIQISRPLRIGSFLQSVR